MAGKCHAPGHGRVIGLGDQLVDLGEESPIFGLERVADQPGHDPVAIVNAGFVEAVLDTCLERVVDRRMIRYHSEAAVAFLYASDKTAETRFEQRIGFDGGLVTILMDGGLDTVSV